MGAEELSKQREFEERSLRENTPEGRRIIELLWDPKEPDGTRGPKPKITLTQIVAGGVALADAEGLEPLSMRKVGKALGVGAMSLYTYVPGKSELLELMVDRVFGELQRPDPSLPWRDQVEFHARESYELYRRHPWLLNYPMARMPLGPNVMDASEAMYASFGQSGLSFPAIVNLVNLITWHVYGFARSVIIDAEEERKSGVSTEAYFVQRGSFWFTYFDPERYPMTTAIYESGAFDDDQAWSFEATLTRLMDGIESLIERSAHDPAGQDG